jgi:hypothetical protein
MLTSSFRYLCVSPCQVVFSVANTAIAIIRRNNAPDSNHVAKIVYPFYDMPVTSGSRDDISDPNHSPASFHVAPQNLHLQYRVRP